MEHPKLYPYTMVNLINVCVLSAPLIGPFPPSLPLLRLPHPVRHNNNKIRPINGLYGEGNGTPLQYSCLENPMDGGAWWAAVHGVAKSRTRLNDFTFTFHFPVLKEEKATHSSVPAWRIPGTGSLVGCPLRGRTESDTTEAT